MNTYVITVHVELRQAWAMTLDPHAVTEFVYRQRVRGTLSGELTRGVHEAVDMACFMASEVGHVLRVSDVSVIKED